MNTVISQRYISHNTAHYPESSCYTVLIHRYRKENGMIQNEHEIIREYVDSSAFDTEALAGYLSTHEYIDGEIFDLCKRETELKRNTRYNIKRGYMPVSREVFVRRIPFYFFRNENYSVFGELEGLLSSLDIDIQESNDTKAPEKLDLLYNELEFLFYKKGFDLKDIFSYIISQYGVASGPFMSWVNYVHLCDDLGWDDFFPDSFMSSYNYALEAAGQPPVIYKIDPMLVYSSEPFYRHGNMFTFDGTFPVDKNGNPVLRWTNLIVKNAGRISCNTKKSLAGSLFIEITPYTIIKAHNLFNEDSYEEYEIYVGPRHIDFDGNALRAKRRADGYTQQEVADAIGASVRTYQKWESGATTPDASYMLRLINWLNISEPALLAKKS